MAERQAVRPLVGPVRHGVLLGPSWMSDFYLRQRRECPGTSHSPSTGPPSGCRARGQAADNSRSGKRQKTQASTAARKISHLVQCPHEACWGLLEGGAGLGWKALECSVILIPALCLEGSQEHSSTVTLPISGWGESSLMRLRLEENSSSGRWIEKAGRASAIPQPSPQQQLHELR